MRILVVDDDSGLRKSLRFILEDGGYEVVTAEDGLKGLEMASAGSFDFILVDVRMPGMDGLTFLEQYRTGGGEALVLVMTAYGSSDLAMKAMKRGAYDYIPKPFGSEEVLLTLRKAEERECLRREVARLRREVGVERRYGDIVAADPAMLQVVETARKVARYPSSLLLQGATGTGKELLARLVHRESERADGPFVAVNCAAIPETLLESEFFGHVKGAFTGAERDREGLFEAAAGGTLFLDEVGELPESLQAKLLRVLQEGEVRRLGESEARTVNVRVVAATNRNLRDDVEDGRFRQDLYYRVAVVTLEVPPLVDRPQDLPRLIRHFLERHSARFGTAVPALAPAAMERLAAHAWPGNVRELENVLERALILSNGERIEAADLPGPLGSGPAVVANGRAGPAPGREAHPNGRAFPNGALNGSGEDAHASNAQGSGESLSVKARGAELERELIRRALGRTGGHRGQAAALLELSDRALRYKIQEYGLEGSWD